MFWNFVTTLFSIPLAARCEPKDLFLKGLLGAAVSCILAFVGMTQQIYGGGMFSGFATIGMAGLVLAFECGMAPMFFILATKVFPEEQRELGCSIVNTTSFVFNLLVLFAFPLAVDAWSPSPDQQIVGTSRTFAAFGGIGLVCYAALQRLL